MVVTVDFFAFDCTPKAGKTILKNELSFLLEGRRWLMRYG